LVVNLELVVRSVNIDYKELSGMHQQDYWIDYADLDGDLNDGRKTVAYICLYRPNLPSIS